MRLDIFLTEQGFYRSRSSAKDGILRGEVFVDGVKTLKVATDITNQKVEVKSLNPFVSRGGLKLQHALDYFKIDLSNKVCLDIGSSTGGFIDCLVQNGAKFAYGVDVGNGILDDKIKTYKNVKVLENTDFKTTTKEDFKNTTLATIDVSFTSILAILNHLKSFNISEVICLIKPQFEAGKEIIKKCKGVIKDKKIHISVLKKVLAEIENLGYFVCDLTYSNILGGSGNIEFLAYLKPTKINKKFDIEKIVSEAYNSLL